jgi:hypothetical protein
MTFIDDFNKRANEEDALGSSWSEEAPEATYPHWGVCRADELPPKFWHEPVYFAAIKKCGCGHEFAVWHQSTRYKWPETVGHTSLVAECCGQTLVFSNRELVECRTVAEDDGEGVWLA